MQKRFYLDSNVFISFVREEIDSALNLRYLESKNFFAFCAKQKHTLVISDWFLEEVKKITWLDEKSVAEEFERLFVEAIFVHEQIDTALVSRISKETGMHLTDAAHIAIALESKADFIVTWNARDFEKANALIRCFSPNEILDIL